MKKLIFLGAAMLLLMAACSHDENNNGGTEPLQKVQFSFTNEDFGADEVPTRSVAEAKPQTIDLGDCEAEISVENEPAVKTRGPLTNANGHYTIRAYQGGTLKGEMKGTFSGGAFTPDASSPKSMNLPDGTYDFIAFNDDVVPSGNELTVTRDKAATAMMGTTTELINQHPDQTVNFTMKHVGCRLRTQLVCKKHFPNAITATLEQTAANVIPTSMSYNIQTQTKTYTNGVMTAEGNNFPANEVSEYWMSFGGQIYRNTSTSDYHYFLPTTEGSKLKLTFTGGIVFWKPLTGTLSQLNATLQMQANKSYVVKIKLKPNYTYLMSDGTTGFFKETTSGGGTKTPIAVVLNEGSHMAIALNNAWTAPKPWCSYAYWYNETNTHIATSKMGAIGSQATSGFDETWDPTYTHSSVTGNKVKATNSDFSACKAAADYDPGVPYTGSPSLKWYLPSANDSKYILSTLGFGDITAIRETSSSPYYGYLADEAFTQVGGEQLSSMNWTSSAYSLNTILVMEQLGQDFSWRSYNKNIHAVVRAFVKY